MYTSRMCWTLSLCLLAVAARAEKGENPLNRFRGSFVTLEHISSELKMHASNVFNLILSTDKVVIDLSASWCGPCKRIAPKLEKMAKERSDVLFVKVDVDAYPEVSGMYSVRSVPTVLFFKNGQMIHRVFGADERAIRSRLGDL